MIDKIILEALVDIQPMLTAAGRSIEVKEANESSCVIVLKGFCGDCACSSSYMEGIEELLQSKMPEMKEIRFELV
jgi:Fe-S cluster biogenesis protein NfuA